MPRGFDPNQPRWPRGMPGVGGQWKPRGLPSALAGAMIDVLARRPSGELYETSDQGEFGETVGEFVGRLRGRQWDRMSVAEALRSAWLDARATWPDPGPDSPAAHMVERLRQASARYGTVAPSTVEAHDNRAGPTISILRNTEVVEGQEGSLTQVARAPMNPRAGTAGSPPMTTVIGPHAVENATPQGEDRMGPAAIDARRHEIRSLGRTPRPELADSPSRSSAGRLRNLGAMREQKLRELAIEMNAGDEGWWDADPLAAEGIYLEFRARGLNPPSYVPTAGAVSPEEQGARQADFQNVGAVVRIEDPGSSFDGEVGTIVEEPDDPVGTVRVEIDGADFPFDQNQVVLSDAATEQAHRDEVDALDVGQSERAAAEIRFADMSQEEFDRYAEDNVLTDEEAVAAGDVGLDVSFDQPAPNIHEGGYSTQGPGGTVELLDASDLQNDPYGEDERQDAAEHRDITVGGVSPGMRVYEPTTGEHGVATSYDDLHGGWNVNYDSGAEGVSPGVIQEYDQPDDLGVNDPRDEVTRWWDDLEEGTRRSIQERYGPSTIPEGESTSDWWESLGGPLGTQESIRDAWLAGDDNRRPERPEDRPVDPDLRASPARSTTGRIRNIRAMRDSRVRDLAQQMGRPLGASMPNSPSENLRQRAAANGGTNAWYGDPMGAARVRDELERRGMDLDALGVPRSLLPPAEAEAPDAMSRLESDLRGAPARTRPTPLERNYLARLNGMAGDRQVRLDTANGTFEGDVVLTGGSRGVDYVELRNREGGGTTRVPISRITGMVDIGSIADNRETPPRVAGEYTQASQIRAGDRIEFPHNPGLSGGTVGSVDGNRISVVWDATGDAPAASVWTTGEAQTRMDRQGMGHWQVTPPRNQAGPHTGSPFRHADGTLRDIDNMTVEELRVLDHNAHLQDAQGTPWNVSDPEGSAILATNLERTGISRRFGETPVSELREARLRAIAAEPSDPRFAEAVRRLQELRPTSRRWRRLAEEHGIEGGAPSARALRTRPWDEGTHLGIHERVLATLESDLLPTGRDNYARRQEARNRAGRLSDRSLAGLVDAGARSYSSATVRRAILYEAGQRGLNPGQQTGAEWLRGRGNREAAGAQVAEAANRLPLPGEIPSVNDLRSHEGLASYIRHALSIAVDQGRLPRTANPEIHVRGQYARVSVGGSTVAYVQGRRSGRARGRVSIVGLDEGDTPENIRLRSDPRHMGDVETGFFPASNGPAVAASVERAASLMLARPQRPRRARAGRPRAEATGRSRAARISRGIAARSSSQLPAVGDVQSAEDRPWSLEVEYEGPEMAGGGGYGGYSRSVEANYRALQRRGFRTEDPSRSSLYSHTFFNGFYDSRGDGTTYGHPEMKFPVMAGPDGDFVAREAFAAMREAGGHSAGRPGSGTAASGFGTHVTIDARDLTMEQHKKVSKSWKNNWDLMDQIVSPARYGARGFTWRGREGTSTPTYAPAGVTAQTSHASSMKWGDQSKLEFRRLEGTLDDDIVVPWAHMMRGLVQHTKRFGSVRRRETLKEFLDLLVRNGNLSQEDEDALLARAREVTRNSPDARVDSVPASAERSMTEEAINAPSSTRTVGGVSRLRGASGRALTPVAQMQEAAIRRVARNPDDPRYREAIAAMRQLRPRSREWRVAAASIAP